MPRRKVKARHRRAEAANAGVPEEGPHIAPAPVEPPKPRKKISAKTKAKIQKAKADALKNAEATTNDGGSGSQSSFRQEDGDSYESS